MKTQIISIIIILLSCSFSCENEQKIDDISKNCQSNSPLTELEWLKNIVTEIEVQNNKATIYQSVYNNTQVFIVDLCVQCPDELTSIYDCNGNIICEFGGYLGTNTCPDFEKNVSEKSLLFEFIPENASFCNSQNPIEDFAWLKELITEANQYPNSKSQIYQCIYKNQQGFVVDLCVQCPDAITYFYDCNGNVLCEFGGYLGTNTCPGFENEITEKQLIWEKD